MSRSFLSVGANLLSHVTNVAGRNDSSDDEKTDLTENEEYIVRGKRGVIVFNTCSVRSKRPKYVHINLHSCTITQYYQSRKKVYQISNIVNIMRNSETMITLEYPGIMDVQFRSKKFLFQTEAGADKFHQYIECLNEMGKHIAEAFDSMDYTKSGKIARDDLEIALSRCDLSFPAEHIERMIRLGLEGCEFIDYFSFFHLFFLKTFVISERECLVEWFHLANDAYGANGNGSVSSTLTFSLLPGEIVIFYTTDRIYYSCFPGKHCREPYYFPGTMYLTNYRTIFVSSRKNITDIMTSTIPTAVSATALTPTNSYSAMNTLSSATEGLLTEEENEVVITTNPISSNKRASARKKPLPPPPPPVTSTGTTTTDSAETRSDGRSETDSNCGESSPKPAISTQYLHHSRYDIPSYFSQISVPLNTLHKVYTKHNLLIMHTKDYRTVQMKIMGFQALSQTQLDSILQMILQLAFFALTSHTSASASSEKVTGSSSTMSSSERSMSTNGGTSTTAHVSRLITLEDLKHHFFAYKYIPQSLYPENHGWNVTDLVKEYVRQGLFSTQEWKCLDNSDYSFSDTYPRNFVVPKLMSLDQLKAAANHRSKQRLPVITYVHRRYVLRGSGRLSTSRQTVGVGLDSTHGAPVLTRSAQPLVGITGKNSAEDEMLLNLYRLKGKSYPVEHNKYSHSKLYILDARGKIAATLNMAAGKGTEDVSAYHNTELLFGNIDNIHVMRNAIHQLTDSLGNTLHPYTPLSTIIGNTGNSEVVSGGGCSIYAKLEESGWWKHVRLLLCASLFVAEKLHLEHASVLVHCSDGWDRTAQICAVAEILLDPYYRTIEGFAVLIEKDWCAFGHKFQERIGHGADHTILPDERSPIFLQYLECCYQIMHQFPTAFEFTDTLLIFIADHLISGLFGNFLGNTDQERKVIYAVPENTQSIWSYVFHYRSHYVNAQYVKYENVLWPSYAYNHLKVWERYWLRYDLFSHPNSLNVAAQWTQDDWGDAYVPTKGV